MWGAYLEECLLYLYRNVGEPHLADTVFGLFSEEYNFISCFRRKSKYKYPVKFCSRKFGPIFRFRNSSINNKLLGKFLNFYELFIDFNYRIDFVV